MLVHHPVLDVFGQLRLRVGDPGAVTGGHQGQLLGLQECGDECGPAPVRRIEIQQLLDAGKSVEEVRAFELEKYGQETFRIPLDRGFNRIVWVLPLAAHSDWPEVR